MMSDVTVLDRMPDSFVRMDLSEAPFHDAAVKPSAVAPNGVTRTTNSVIRPARLSVDYDTLSSGNFNLIIESRNKRFSSLY